MKILLVDNQTDSLKQIEKLCMRDGSSYKLVQAENLTASVAAEYDLVVLSGGMWYEDMVARSEHYRSELEYIANSKPPIIGICLGMQLIALAFGGQIEKLTLKHHGYETIRLNGKGQEALKLPKDLEVYKNHTRGLMSAPKQFDVLAASDECIEIICHKTLPILGVQFHPEKSKSELIDKIWQSLIQAHG